MYENHIILTLETQVSPSVVSGKMTSSLSKVTVPPLLFSCGLARLSPEFSLVGMVAEPVKVTRTGVLG